jgi:hypothetical protein
MPRTRAQQMMKVVITPKADMVLRPQPNMKVFPWASLSFPHASCESRPAPPWSFCVWLDSRLRGNDLRGGVLGQAPRQKTKNGSAAFHGGGQAHHGRCQPMVGQNRERGTQTVERERPAKKENKAAFFQTWVIGCPTTFANSDPEQLTVIRLNPLKKPLFQ